VVSGIQSMFLIKYWLLQLTEIVAALDMFSLVFMSGCVGTPAAKRVCKIEEWCTALRIDPDSWS
jgi:hypothetical protein